MPQSIASLVLAGFLASCGMLMASDEKNAALIDGYLFNYAKLADYPVQYENRAFRIGDHLVKFTQVMEKTSSEEDGKKTVIRFEVSMDGMKQEQLSYLTTATGESAEQAALRAGHDWIMMRGHPLMDALGGAPPHLRTEMHLIYRGPVAFAGTLPDGWVKGSQKMDALVFGVIEKHLSKDQGKRISGAWLKITMKQDGTIKGQCLIYGQESPEAFAEIQGLGWPIMTNPYTVNLGYIAKSMSS